MVISGSTSELRLLADPTRARIMSLLLDSDYGRAAVGALAAELKLRQPTVSHHLKALFDEGFLDREPEGRNVWYSVRPDQVDRVTDLLGAGHEGTPDDGVLDRISEDLAARFVGTFARETVDRYVRESFALLAERANITRHLPSLTSRFAADRLSALASADLPGHGIPEVLFVCVQNAGRSQMAAGILRHLAGDRVHVRTAGSAPASALRAVVVTALDEIGVPIGGEYPKPLTDDVVRAADVVITMGCGDACPVYPGRRYLDWDLEDPVGLPLARVREIRDDIDARVRDLLSTLQVNAA
ncbi:metalloregulator ArsR/SmtB family transcription factor [Mycetocola sp. 2940]|uniref:metalloregulator ArsR/SmtB family transcription factor n=1 Tax=Mycetocola sp. 2940 TaxID=3156452 RepID=UPI003394B71D